MCVRGDNGDLYEQAYVTTKHCQGIAACLVYKGGGGQKELSEVISECVRHTKRHCRLCSDDGACTQYALRKGQRNMVHCIHWHKPLLL